MTPSPFNFTKDILSKLGWHLSPAVEEGVGRSLLVYAHRSWLCRPEMVAAGKSVEDALANLRMSVINVLFEEADEAKEKAWEAFVDNLKYLTGDTP